MRAPRSLALARTALLGALLLASACRFDRADRWLGTSDEPTCELGKRRCTMAVEECAQAGRGQAWKVVDDCGARGAVCDEDALRCLSCAPGARGCLGGDVATCRADGSGSDVAEACDHDAGLSCRGGKCVDLCADAASVRSNVGCEYFAVDLDNAYIDPTSNAAAQQYAVVVSNPDRDVTARVTITQDDSLPGEPPQISVIATGKVQPRSLTVFKLGPREVDGSPEGEYDTGTGTALTRRAFKVVADFPVVAYQFNPLENANVFSNDASLLRPVTALAPSLTKGELLPAYAVLGWPQTIAHTDDPNTNFSATDPIDLRAFLTLVGTRPDTRVRLTTTARIIPGGPVPETPKGGVVDLVLQPYEVLNLETGGFNADFTGSIVEADGPVVVFSGSEASDAPFFQKLSERSCCADHLEEQLDPIRTAGMRFIAPHGPSRTAAVKAAGASVALIDEPDFFRVVTALPGTTTVKTSLPPPDDSFSLEGRGALRDLSAKASFTVVASQPVLLGNVSPSQEAAGIKRGLPGGDPSLLIVPPIEQWRSEYVFLTPDKYAFDFVTIVVPQGRTATLDGDPVEEPRCVRTPGDGLTDAQRKGAPPEHWVFVCQLSFATIDPKLDAPDNLKPGKQNDGVHRVVGTSPVGVLVSGFDSYVSYSYAAGTDLREINVQ